MAGRKYIAANSNYPVKKNKIWSFNSVFLHWLDQNWREQSCFEFCQNFYNATFSPKFSTKILPPKWVILSLFN